eukprot:941425-Pyramimonas_sp.AAC.1
MSFKVLKVSVRRNSFDELLLDLPRLSRRIEVNANMHNLVNTVVTAFPDDLGSALVKDSFICVHSTEEVEEALGSLLKVSQTEDGRNELISISAAEKLAVPTWRVCRWWCDDAGGVREVTVNTEGEKSDEAQTSSGAVGDDAVAFWINVTLSMRVTKPLCEVSFVMLYAMHDSSCLAMIILTTTTQDDRILSRVRKSNFSSPQSYCGF